MLLDGGVEAELERVCRLISPVSTPQPTDNHLDRHYEVTLDVHEGFVLLSQIALLLRRLDGSQLFDTL
jgi:hypothetical protein